MPKKPLEVSPTTRRLLDMRKTNRRKEAEREGAKRLARWRKEATPKQKAKARRKQGRATSKTLAGLPPKARKAFEKRQAQKSHAFWKDASLEQRARQSINVSLGRRRMPKKEKEALSERYSAAQKKHWSEFWATATTAQKQELTRKQNFGREEQRLLRGQPLETRVNQLKLALKPWARAQELKMRQDAPDRKKRPSRS